MKLRKVIVYSLVIPALVYVGIRGYMWYSIKDKMTDLQNHVSSYAKLEYTEIRTPILGPVGVTGVSLTPHTSNDSITIGSILVDWKDPIDLVYLIEASFNETIPEKLKISVNGVSIPLTGDLGDWLDRSTGTLDTFGVFGCATRQLTYADYKNMGIDAIVSDTGFEYRFNRRTGNISFYSRMRHRDLMTLIFEGVIPSNEISLSQAGITSKVPRLTNFSITYEDQTFNERRISYCAKESGLSESDYIEHHIEGFTSSLASKKLFPSAELLVRYRDFLSDAGKLTVIVNPYEPIGPDDIVQFEGLDLTDALDLEVLFNQTPVTEVFALQSTSEVVVEEEEQQQRAESFQLTPIGTLPQFINHQVRVVTTDDKSHLANLDSVNRDNLILTRHELGGSVTFAVPKAQIQQVLVLY